VHPGAGTARYALTNFPMGDFHDIGSGLSGGPSDPGSISFEILFAGRGRRAVQTDGKTFSYDSVISSATVRWSSVNKVTGMKFVSDPASTSRSLYAAVGHEKNGRFFG
jgi:hypothetical protein